MQFSLNFAALTASIVAVLAMTADASPAPQQDASYVVSNEAMMHWLATTDAELTFVGEPINPLSRRAAQNTVVTYCNTRAFNVCGGACTVYNGGATCLRAPGTNCLAATHNVAFCSGGSCDGGCNQLSTCGTRLDNGFCYTPATNSIIVSPA